MVRIAALAILCCPWICSAEDAHKPFASTTIDIGFVVSDIEKSVKFYKDVVGLKEVTGFNVPGSYATKVGLTNGKELKVRVLVLGDGESATKLKLMEFPDSKPKKNDNSAIDKELGVRYLTIFTSDTNAALARLEKNGVKPIAQGPQPLPKGFPEGVFLTIIRDPDGNLVELVGPKK